jgi:CrcB protein
VAVALGGAAGAGVRWAVVTLSGGGWLPWPVLAVNVGGSFVLGVLLAEEWTHPRTRVLLHDAGAIGFCGGLTTFSTFAVEIVDLIRADRAGAAALYAVLSVVLCVAAVLAGAGVLRRTRAAALPVEEEP